MGNPPYGRWLVDHPGITPGTFREAAAAADELVVNGIDGRNAVTALTAISDSLAGKVLVDYAVPFIYDPEVEHPRRRRGGPCRSSTRVTPAASASRSSGPCPR
ncbi:hypothetical protein AB0B01_27510 [Streptomyces sp. NPDC044571]|uniref:hypothetical protein n=1 Tax=Streptomyces sp. NPDC044571 TaxID=3155371 RepID=UPI0033D9A402